MFSRTLCFLVHFMLVGSAYCMDPVPATYPSGCHALSFHANGVLESSDYPNYDSLKNIVKTDVVCIGDTLRIDSALRSNGGDIVIYARKVDLAAPIDTRIYVDHASINYFQHLKNPYNGLLYGSEEPLRNGTNGGIGDRRYYRSYLSYYTQCDDCQTDSSHAWIPRMPSGLTPAFPLNQTFKRAQIDGLAPPINKLALSIYRSGNIYIIAEQVNFHGQEISTQKDEEPLFDASGHPRRYFLVTQGLGGGLGGAGSPSDCTNYLNPGGFGDCADGEFLNSGRTGPGGPGGDAGAAYWIHIGGSWSGDFLSIAKRLTSVSGGAPGPNKRFRSPTARGALGATGQANDFLKLQDGSWDQEASGKDGAVVFQAMSAERSLDFVGQLLREKDAQFDYDLSILAKRASTDESITSVTYDDFMAESLGRFIQGGQIHVVDSFEKLIVDKAIDHVPFIPSHLLGLEGSAATLSTLSSSNRQLVRLLTELSSPIDPPISEYFARSGGLFSNFDVKSTKQDLNELYRSVDTSKLNQRLVDLRVPLADISSTLANFDIRQDKNDRLAQLSILKKQLEEAQSKSGSEWMVKLSGGLEEMASAVKNLYAGYSSDNPGMVVVGMRDLVSGWEKARSAWASQDDTGSTAGINQDLAAAESSYNDFLISVEASRQRHSNDSISALIDVLQSRAESGSRILARTKLFDSLIKSSYLMYVDDNGKNVNNFSSNMDGIRTLLIDYPRIVPNINLVNETDNNCVDVQNTCLKIGPQLRQVAVVTPWTLSDGRTTNITLYIVAPTTKPEFFQTRGLDAVIESDGGNTVTKETRGTAAP